MNTAQQLLTAAIAIGEDNLPDDVNAWLCWPTLALSGTCPIGPQTLAKLADAILDAEGIDDAAEAYFDGSDDDELLLAIIEAKGIDLDAHVAGDDELTAILLVCREFDCRPCDCTVDDGGLYGYGLTVTADGAEYAVLTDDDADLAWEDALESYLDDGCVEGADSHYFDREAWKRDARIDGRGHCLSCYDGNEYDARINGEWYAIYRTN